jgi:Protein of unknown function (DUF2865)
MSRPMVKRMIAAAVFAGAAALPPSAHAEDFISTLFGAISRGFQPPSSGQPPFGGDPSQAEPPRPRVSLGGPAWCVRTCDGRYFPIPPSEQSRAVACNNFCPAAETKVVYGGSIDAAATEDGRMYAQLPNAFRYRSELVAGCSCNGHDTVGLAQIPIQDDPTLRKGDLVAGASGGLSAASNDASRRAQSSYSQAPDAVRTR